MAVKASDLKNKLPEGGKKNCKECGLPTCFAFAMKLAKGGIELDKCPYLEPEVRAEIEEALTPPMVLVTIGQGEEAVQIGEEEVMYRHEKTFLREPALAILVSDKESETAVAQKLEAVKNSVSERAQVILKPNLLALSFDSGDRSRFEALARKAHEALPLSAVLLSEDLEALFAAREVYQDRNPLVYPITGDNLEAALPRLKEAPGPVGLKAEGVEGLLPLTERLKAEGINQLVLDPSSKSLAEAVQDQTIIRRAALKAEVRALGYPTLAFPCALTGDRTEEALLAGAFIAKYAGVIVLSNAAPEFLFPLLVLRMDIYTDPRKLRTVEAKVYEVNAPGAEAPVLVTTNFALTYFSVSSEAESSRIPTYVAVLDTGGFGVETAMAAGKFDGILVAEFLKEQGLDERLTTKRLILPWLARRLRNELLEELPGWEVIVGPKEANELAGFLVEQSGQWG